MICADQSAPPRPNTDIDRIDRRTEIEPRRRRRDRSEARRPADRRPRRVRRAVFGRPRRRRELSEDRIGDGLAHAALGHLRFQPLPRRIGRPATDRKQRDDALPRRVAHRPVRILEQTDEQRQVRPERRGTGERIGRAPSDEQPYRRLATAALLARQAEIAQMSIERIGRRGRRRPCERQRCLERQLARPFARVAEPVDQPARRQQRCQRRLERRIMERRDQSEAAERRERDVVVGVAQASVQRRQQRFVDRRPFALARFQRDLELVQRRDLGVVVWAGRELGA